MIPVLQPFPRRLLLSFVVALIAPISPSVSLGAADEPVWYEIPRVEPTWQPVRLESGSESAFLRLDPRSLEKVLIQVPEERLTRVADSQTLLRLPLPEGGFASFRVVESPIMEDELATKYPHIRTFRGEGIVDRSLSTRFDLTPHGFHAVIFGLGSTVFIDPVEGAESMVIQSYRIDQVAAVDPPRPHCLVSESVRHSTLQGNEFVALESGSQLRQYRIAVAATGEYTQFHGGTIEDGLGAIVVAMNRVNGVYEREVAIRMNLVAANDVIVYTDPATDPYTNSSGIAMLGQNQANLDTVIGSANYDIGHVFSTGGGGVASLAVTCKSSAKARGVTGLSAPTGDVFWIDFVSHELGHQWGANHTFNGTSGNCGGGNRNGATAYEPGSGSTIMAYAGICGSQNLQPNSDDYFHGNSFDEIVTYSTLGFGNSCADASATGNDAPLVDSGSSWVVPIDTPFELCGGATDPNGDAMTFNWEQFDTGPAGAPDSPSGDAPIFRSFPATPSPCRTFPRIEDVLGSTQTIGEILPTYDRTLNFRLTARDDRLAGGGVGFDPTTTVTVSSDGGPFRVTSPDQSSMWSAGGTETVIWDVAGTVDPPISCADVDIALSVDGDFEPQYLLASATTNDGIESVHVPSSVPATSQARVLVRCSTGIFFDISDEDFDVDDSQVVFADDFETGDTRSWNGIVP